MTQNKSTKDPYDDSAQRPKFTLALLKPQYWKSWLVFLLIKLLGLLPLCALRQLAKLLSYIFTTSKSKYVRKRRQIAKINIDLTFKNHSEEFRKQLFDNFCRSFGYGMIDIIFAWGFSNRRFKSIIKYTNDFSEVADKEPFLFLGGHFINLESHARAIGMIYPSYGVYLINNNPAWEWIQYHSRVKNNKGLVHRNNLRVMLSIIKSCKGLWYLPDQDLDPKQQIFAPFFDEEYASTTKGTYMFFKMVPNIKLVPTILVPSDDPQYLYELKILPAVGFEENDDEETVIAKTNKLLENLVLQNPAYYLWLHRRYKNRKDKVNVYSSVH